MHIQGNMKDEFVFIHVLPQMKEIYCTFSFNSSDASTSRLITDGDFPREQWPVKAAGATTTSCAAPATVLLGRGLSYRTDIPSQAPRRHQGRVARHLPIAASLPPDRPSHSGSHELRSLLPWPPATLPVDNPRFLSPTISLLAYGRRGH
jgi:hypothetical protein